MSNNNTPTNQTISQTLGIPNTQNVPATNNPTQNTKMVVNEIIKDTKDDIKQWDKEKRETQLNEDFDYSRAKLYQLMETGQEALMGILEVAQESEHPRAYEVCAQLIKNNSELVKALTMLHKDSQDVVQTMDPNERESRQDDSGNVTNNNLFVGSSQELLEMLEKMNKKDKE